MRRHDYLRAVPLECPDDLGHVLDSEAKACGRIDRAAVVRKRVELDHHLPGPASEMDRPSPVLFLAQCDAKGLVKEPKLLNLAGFQHNEGENNVGHECDFRPISRQLF